MQPEDSRPADLIPEDFLANRCQDYILVEADISLSGAVEKLQNRKGDLEWSLVVSSPTGYTAAPFKEILKWERGQSDRSSVRSTNLAELDLPLAALDVVDDNALCRNCWSSANRHPYGLVLVAWEGTGLVYGVAEIRKNFRAFETHRSRAHPSACRKCSRAA